MGMVPSAKSYCRKKYLLSIIGMFYNVALLLVFLGSGLSLSLEKIIGYFGFAPVLPAAVFLLVILVSYYLLSLPLNFYSSYTLEHEYGLSRQGISGWWMEQLKSEALTYVISLLLVLLFYWIISRFAQWWLVVSFAWVVFNVVLAKLVPVLIIPLFFKYKKLEDEPLRRRILDLAARMRVRLLDVFEIDFSKKTLKANAALIGIGVSRRVILADTLKDKYTHEEIEAVIAHEFAHSQRGHIPKLIVVNALLSMGLFYLIFRTNAHFLGVFRLDSLAQPAGLPLILLYFAIFGILLQPLEAYVSRVFEREADSLALKAIGKKEAFISMMEKLAQQNLADRNPHPLVKFFFFDHPPIDERIKSANRN